MTIYTSASGTASLIAETWPYTPENVRISRRWLRDRLAAEAGETRDDTVQILGEMLANMVAHTRTTGPDGEFTVAVDTGGPLVFVALTDGGAETVPTIQKIDPARSESGRGMHIVERIALKHGYVPHSRGGTTWAVIERKAGR